MADIIFYVFAFAFMALIFVLLKRRRTVAAVKLEPARQADAARLGWTFETGESAFYEMFRWRGTTDGIAWVAEGLRSGQHRGSRQGSVTKIIRWQTERPLAVKGSLAVIPAADGDDPIAAPRLEEDGKVAELMESLVAAAYRKAFALRFGETLAGAVDMTTMTTLTAAIQTHPKTAVLATETAHTDALWTLQKVDAAMALPPAPGAPMAILVTPAGLAISAAVWIPTADDLQPIVQRGVALTKTLSS